MYVYSYVCAHVYVHAAYMDKFFRKGCVLCCIDQDVCVRVHVYWRTQYMHAAACVCVCVYIYIYIL
jgi:hypothetical protein